MYQKGKRLIAVLCVLAMMILALPVIPAKAATTVPKFKKTYASVYENGVDKGKYTYTLINLKKGWTVKWSVSGEGKSYVSLKNTTTKATKSSVSNTLTVKTGGKTAAKNKKVTLTATFYSAEGKKLGLTKANAKIKIKPTKVAVNVPEEADDVLFVGKSYQFKYTLTPVNATSTNVWTVTSEDGNDYSSFISSTGVFKPEQPGIYTIKVAAKIGTKTIKSASASVEVIDYMVSLEQLAANKIELTYSGDMREEREIHDFVVKNAAGSSVVVKEIAFSDDGKKVTLTMYSNFQDAVNYTVSDGQCSLNFEASVGAPVSLKILTQTVTVGKETAVACALYDKNGVDVTGVYEGTLEYQAEATNGYLVPGTNKLLMMQIGNTATVTVKYTGKADSMKLDGTTVIMCVAAELSDDTNFTLTTATTAPDYTLTGYKDSRKVAIGNSYYAHFRALDKDKSEIKYSSVTYESSDPDTMIITPAGKVTPIKSGSVKVIVTAVYANEKYTYSYDVTIAEAPYLKSISLSKSSVTMSNVYNMDYCQYIEVTALDQYGESMLLTNETASFVDNNIYNSINKRSLVTYDAASDRVEVKAPGAVPGTYTYTLTVTANGKEASADFVVVVSNIPTTGTDTYEILIDKKKADLSLNEDISSSQSVNVRLAKYRNGIFMNYTSFNSVTVTKDGYYYGSDLSLGGTTAKQVIGANSQSTQLSLKTLDITSGVCRKAATGIYTISLQYYSSEAKGYMTLTTTLTLTDTQDKPQVSIDRITAGRSCANALELAQNCLTPETGTITECVVTGETQPGSKVVLKPGDQINIPSVTVVNTYKIAGGQEVTVTYIISVRKTLTNL